MRSPGMLIFRFCRLFFSKKFSFFPRNGFVLLLVNEFVDPVFRVLVRVFDSSLYWLFDLN